MLTEWSEKVTERHKYAIESIFSHLSVDRMAEIHSVKSVLHNQKKKIQMNI